MRRNKALDSSAYVFQVGEKILVDANVWLYLFPSATQPPPRYAEQYSEAMKKLLQARAKPVVDALVLSEYINRSLRLAYAAEWKRTYLEFKDFRCSKDFTAVAKLVIEAVKRILKDADVESTVLTKADLPWILAETERGSLDFNDGAIVETCRLRGMKLLTNDGDMKLGGIEVLTSNPRLLAACP